MKKILLAILFLGVLGCGRSAPSNYYLLESMTAGVHADSLPRKTLRIAQVNTADYLHRNNIVSRVKNETRLILAEFHLWVEPVSNGIRRVMEEIMGEQMRQNGIAVLPSGTEEKGDFVLLLDVQRLDGNFNENAVLECYWTLLDERENPINRGRYVAEEMVQGADYNILVKAESSLIRKLALYLADRLPAQMGKRDPNHGQ